MSATASLQKKWNQLCNVIWDDPEAKQVERTAGKEAGEQDKEKDEAGIQCAAGRSECRPQIHKCTSF